MFIRVVKYKSTQHLNTKSTPNPIYSARSLCRRSALRLTKCDRETAMRCRHTSKHNGSTETIFQIYKFFVLQNGINIVDNRWVEVPPSMLFPLLFFVVPYEREFHYGSRAVFSAAFSSHHACVRTYQYVATSTWVSQYVFMYAYWFTNITRAVLRSVWLGIVLLLPVLFFSPPQRVAILTHF